MQSDPNEWTNLANEERSQLIQETHRQHIPQAPASLAPKCYYKGNPYFFERLENWRKKKDRRKKD